MNEEEWQKFCNEFVIPYLEEQYAVLERELDYWNNPATRELRNDKRGFASVGDMLRRNHVAIIGRKHPLISTRMLHMLNGNAEQAYEPAQYVQVAKQFLESQTTMDGLTVDYDLAKGIYISKR